MLDLIMLAAGSDPTQFCAGTANVWQFVGYVLMVFKIVVPLLLIIFGMIDLGKAVIGSKEDEIKKSTMSLVRRAIAAVVIFFIPTIVSVIFGLVTDDQYWKPCRQCVSNPLNADCKSAADAANNQ